MKVLQYPLTQITFFFVVGIIFNRYFSSGLNDGLYYVVAAFFLFILAFIFNFGRNNVILVKTFTTSCFILSFAIGNFSAVVHQHTNVANHYSHFSIASNQNVKMKVVLTERWKPTEKNTRFVGDLYELNGKVSTGKILLNFRRDKTTADLKIGSKVAINSKLLQLQKPLNPDQFDYSSFLKNKSIYGQVYADDSSIAVFSTVEKSIFYYSAIFRNRVIENLKNSGFNAKELGVVHALILGQRQDLDPTVLQNYQYAGAIHILSVSGLHVGFVLIFLKFFLNFLPNSNRFRVFKVLVIILILWCFALVAGFTPSVVRSVTMFSFVAVGMYMRRKTYIFYTFYCSIFLILLFQPSFLFDVGFQLSYMALFFILWLQPEFVKVWQPKNIVLDHLWQVLTITFAAQLGTMPLSLYYFHQFPGLFFVTNLLVMFLITCIMFVGLITVLIAFWTVIPTLFAKILEKMIWFLNYIVEQVASFESFIFKDISFNFWMMATLYLVIFGIGWFLIKRNFRNTSILLASILGFQLSAILFDFNAKNKNEMLVFNSKYSSLILERSGEKVTVFSSAGESLIRTDRNIISFNVANGTTITDVQEIPELLFFRSKKILILDSTSVFVPNLKPSILIISQSPKVNFDRFLAAYQPEVVIADASNYRNVVEKLRKTCDQKKIPFHAVAEKGFYRIE